jgi:hypothetical protein
MKNLKFAACLVFVSTTALGSNFSDLSPENQALIQKGEIVTVYTPNSDAESNWPKAAAYKRMEATPEETTAVYSDVEIQKDYIDRLKVSHIAERLSPTSTIVDYELKVPFLLRPFFKDTRYSVQDDLSFDSATNTYTIQWKMVKGSFLKKIEGHASFEALGTGTLVAYINEMSPSSKALNNGLVVKEIKKGSKEAVEAIIAKIADERANHQDVLQEQILRLRESLAK